jgi:hypothetical protein
MAREDYIESIAAVIELVTVVVLLRNYRRSLCY